MSFTIGMTIVWIAAILIMREVKCWRWRHRRNRRHKNTPIDFKDRRRR